LSEEPLGTPPGGLTLEPAARLTLAIRMTWTALPITSGWRRSPLEHIPYPCVLLSAKHKSEGRVMPIVSLLREAAFDPETTRILATAFNKAWDKFKSSGSALADDACAPSTRALLAKQIIETSRNGERNIDRLVENGVAYLREIK
jgi:hypothetical protein